MKLYSFPENYDKKSGDYTVTAKATQIIGVYYCNVSAYPFNRVWPGKQRSASQTEKMAYVMLGSDGEITLDIECTKSFEQAVVRPLSKKIVAHKIRDKKIGVTFPGPGQYCIQFDDMHNVLMVFINPEKEFDIKKDDVNVIYYGPGVHYVDEKIVLRDNQTLFIDQGAVVYGAVEAIDKKNVSVVGYGILDNSRMFRYNEVTAHPEWDEATRKRVGKPIYFDRCENAVVDGITIVDSSEWTIRTDGCCNVLVNNVKVIGNWRYNTDGCDFCNSTNCIISDSFLRNFDDGIVVKGRVYDRNLPVQNILAENCVVWTDWSKSLEVGVETCAPYLSDITFRNCDIIQGGAIIMDITQADMGDVTNVRFEDIRVEYTGCEQIGVIQESDEHEYPVSGEKYMPQLFAVQSGSLWYSNDAATGNIQDIYFKNIRVYTPDGTIPQGSKIRSYNETGHINGVYFEDIYVNDQKCSLDMLGVKIGDRVSGVQEQ